MTAGCCGDVLSASRSWILLSGQSSGVDVGDVRRSRLGRQRRASGLTGRRDAIGGDVGGGWDADPPGEVATAVGEVHALGDLERCSLLAGSARVEHVGLTVARSGVGLVDDRDRVGAMLRRAVGPRQERVDRSLVGPDVNVVEMLTQLQQRRRDREGEEAGVRELAAQHDLPPGRHRVERDRIAGVRLRPDDVAGLLGVRGPPEARARMLAAEVDRDLVHGSRGTARGRRGLGCGNAAGRGDHGQGRQRCPDQLLKSSCSCSPLGFRARRGRTFALLKAL